MTVFYVGYIFSDIHDKEILGHIKQVNTTIKIPLLILILYFKSHFFKPILYTVSFLLKELKKIFTVHLFFFIRHIYLFKV